MNRFPLAVFGILIIPACAISIEPAGKIEVLLELSEYSSLLGEGSTDSIISACSRALKGELPAETRVVILTKRAEANLRAGRMEAAVADYESAIHLSPKCHFAHHRLIAIEASKNPQKAIQLLERITTKNEFPAYYVLLANSLISLGREKQAAAPLETAIKLLPDEDFVNKAQAFHLRAYLAIVGKQYDAAILDLNHSIRLDPLPEIRPEERYLLRAILLLKTQNPAQAMRDVIFATRVAPEAVEPRYTLWTLYVMMGKFNVALEYASRWATGDSIKDEGEGQGKRIKICLNYHGEVDLDKCTSRRILRI